MTLELSLVNFKPYLKNEDESFHLYQVFVERFFFESVHKL